MEGTGWTVTHKCNFKADIEWNLSNLDTFGAEESVLISEVS